MATPLSLETDRRDDGTLVLIATGELDLSNIGSFTHALVGAVSESDSAGKVTVDLSRVEYLDSGAINALFDHAVGTRVIVNPILMPVLTISGLTELATVEPAPRPADH